MRRTTFAGAFLLALAAIGLVYASASYARETSANAGGPFAPPFPTSSAHTLLQRELAVYTRRGLSPARAARAVAAQEAVAKAGIVSKLQAALGGAYAGVWLDPSAGQVHVGVTSAVGGRQVERIASDAGLSSSVVATPVRSTWSQLLAAQQRWKNRLQRLFARGEVMTGVNPRQNALEVTLSSSVSSPERARLRRQAKDAGVNVRVAVLPTRRIFASPETNETACKAFAEDKAYCDKPLTSGVGIESEEIGGKIGLCTAGPMGIPRATKLGTYLLVAGHCIAKWGGNGKKWYSLERNEAGSVKEIGKATTYVFGEKGDFGAIQINEPGLWTSEIGDNPLFAVTAEWGVAEPLISYPIKEELAPMLNATSCHEGQTSGEACGEISALSVEVVEGGVTVKGLTEVIKFEKAPLGGDSGGPELKKEPLTGEALVEGIFVSRLETEIKTGFFDSMATVLKELKAVAMPALNLELLTKNNEVRPKATWLKAGAELTKEEPATTDGEWFFHHKVPALFGGGEITLACAGTLKGDVSTGGADKVTAFLGLHGEKENEILCNVSASTNSLCKAGTAVLVKALHLPWITKLEKATIGEEVHIVDALSAEASTPGWEATCSSIKTSCSTNDRARFVQNLGAGAMFELTGELSASCSDGGTATTTGHSEVLGFTV